MRKIILSLSLLFAFVFVLNTQANAQKIGYVQVDSVASMMPEYKAATAKLQELQKVIQKDLQGKEQQLQARYAELQQQAQGMTEVQRQQAQQEIQEKSLAFQEAQTKAESDFTKRQNDLLFPIYEKIREAIKAVGKENNFVLILNELDGTNTAYILYSAEGTDVTDLVVKKMGL